MLCLHAHSIHSGDLVYDGRSRGRNHLEVEGREWRDAPFGPAGCGRAARRYQSGRRRHGGPCGRIFFYSTWYHAVRAISHLGNLEACRRGNDSEFRRSSTRCAAHRSGTAARRSTDPVLGWQKGGRRAERTRLRVARDPSWSAHTHCERIREHGQKVAGQLAGHLLCTSILGRSAASGPCIATAQIAAARCRRHSISFHLVADSPPLCAGAMQGPALALDPPRHVEVKSGG